MVIDAAAQGHFFLQGITPEHDMHKNDEDWSWNPKQ